MLGVANRCRVMVCIPKWEWSHDRYSKWEGITVGVLNGRGSF